MRPLLNNDENKRIELQKEKLHKFLDCFGKGKKPFFIEKLKKINFLPPANNNITKSVSSSSTTVIVEPARRLSSRVSSSSNQQQQQTTNTATSSKTSFGKSVLLLEKKVVEVYKIIKKNKLGGDGAGGPMYGELTEDSFQKIINTLKAKYRLSENSRFIDIGCGQGKPNLHLAQDPVNVYLSVGIEVQDLRWQVSYFEIINDEHFLSH
jgi:hypothetical protein